MTRDAFRALLRPLLAAYRITFDAPAWLAYYQVLDGIPERLVQAAIERAAKDNREFFPRAGELRTMAEEARLALIAAHPWRQCADCADRHGWIELTDARGVTRVQRCGCLQRHLAALAADGIPTESIAALPAGGEAPLALPPASSEPTLDPKMLGALRDLSGIARRHRMPSTSLPIQTDLDGRPLEGSHR